MDEVVKLSKKYIAGDSTVYAKLLSAIEKACRSVNCYSDTFRVLSGMHEALDNEDDDDFEYEFERLTDII